MENQNNNEEQSNKIMTISLCIVVVIFLLSTALIFFIANSKNKNKISKNNVTQSQSITQKSITVVPKTPVFASKEPFEFLITRKIGITGNPSKVKITIGLPDNIKYRQKVSNLKITPSPDKITNSDNGQTAVLLFQNPPSTINIYYKGTALSQTYTMNRAVQTNKNIDGMLTEDELKKYTSPEKGIESDDILIKRIAKSIRDGKNREESVKNIFDYVAGNLIYDANILNSERGAFYAASNGRGTCTEYSALFVAVCRAKNIPARVVKGFNLPFTDNIQSEYTAHAWVEVYFDEYGWVNFDPTISYNNKIMNYIKQNGLSFYDVVNMSTLNRRYLVLNNTDIHMNYETKNSSSVSLTNYGDKISFGKIKK